MKTVEQELAQRALLFVLVFLLQLALVRVFPASENALVGWLIAIAHTLAVGVYLYCFFYRWFFFRLIRYIITGKQ